jgi:hypothetical protein
MLVLRRGAYDGGMGTRSRGSADSGNSVELATRALPPTLRWVLVAAAAALCGVLAGFAMGLARPRLKG